MDLTREQLILWRQQGMSNVEIADRIGKTVGTVNVLFSKYRIPRRSRAVPKEKTEAMVRMRKNGQSTKEIAKKLGVSPCTVNNYIKAAGLVSGQGKDEGLPKVFIMAVPRVPQITRVVIRGHSYLDVTDFFIQG